jgi:hypothetical protein
MEKRVGEKINSMLLTLNWNIASVVIGALGGLGQFVIPEANRLSPVFSAIVVGLLTRNIGYLIQLTIKNNQDEILNRISAEISENLGAIREVEVKASLLNRGELTRSAGSAIIQQYSDGIKQTDYGFQVSAKDWAFVCIREFWNLLKVKQKSSRANNESLEVNVTHSAAIELWEGGKSVTDETLGAQSEFVRDGGKIRRVFIGRDPKPDSRYLRVMSRMKKDHNIDVFYVSLDKVRLDLKCDFMWVKGFDVVMKWYTGQGGTVHTCELVDKVENDVRELWNAIDPSNGIAKSLDEIEKQPDPYEGDYHGYHYSTGGEKIIVSHWTMRSYVPNKLEVEVEEEDFFYEGNMEFLAGQIYFLLSGKTHKEKWHIVCNQPLNPRGYIKGVYSGLSVINNKPFGGLILLTREEINESKAKELLGDEKSISIF